MATGVPTKQPTSVASRAPEPISRASVDLPLALAVRYPGCCANTPDCRAKRALATWIRCDR